MSDPNELTVVSAHASEISALAEEPALVALGLRVSAVLGEGGSAVVYRARDSRHGRDVAVKVIKSLADAERTNARFAQEIRVAGRLRHPHILPLFDSGTLGDGRQFCVLPVAQGDSLRAHIEAGPIPVDDVIRLAHEIAEALAHVHANGFVHRDVKPENVLIEGGHAVLMDFGLAAPMHARSHDALIDRSAATQPEAAGRFTEVGSVVGTPAYMSPEALLGDEPIDGRRDLYSLGITIYEMLTGTLPFGMLSPSGQLVRSLGTQIPSARSLRPDVPSPLDAIIAKATSREPRARYGSATEMADALSALAFTLGTPTSRQVARGLRRRRIVTSAAVVMLLGCAIAWALLRTTEALDPQRIVIADLVNDTGDSTLSGIGVLASDVVAAGLAADPSQTVVNAAIAIPSRFQTRLPTADSVLARETRALVQSARAGVVVTGAYFRSGPQLQAVAEVIDTRSSRVLGVAGPVFFDASRPDSALRSLGDSVVAILRRRP